MKGLSFSFIQELYDKKPSAHELVLYASKRLWLVDKLDRTKCSMREMKGNTVGTEVFESEDPQATNYWYMPFTNGKIQYASLREEDDPESE